MPPKCEMPPPPAYFGKYVALSERKTTGAYDDQLPPAKRIKVMSGDRNYMERPLPLFPATSMAAFTFGTNRYNVNRSISRVPREDTPRTDPIASMGMLRQVPTEVRDEIFRYILLCRHDIRVLRVWSLVFPRTRPRLDLGLLRTCEVFRRQGLRILYGENRFVYLIRDPSENDAAAMSYSMNHVFEHSKIPIDRYGHLIRHIRIIVEANRMTPRHIECFVRAVAKFGPDDTNLLVPANLHSVTIEVPAVTQRDLNLNGYIGVFGDGDNDDDNPAAWNPRDVPIRRFFNKRAIDALEKLNTQFIHVLAAGRRGRFFESVIDMRYHVGDRRRKRQRKRLVDARRESNKNEGDEVMRRTREGLARAAIAHLRNLPFALELLALYPHRPVHAWHLWDIAALPAAKPDDSNQDVFLPDDFCDDEELAGHVDTVASAQRRTPTPQPSSLDFMQSIKLAQKAAKRLKVAAAEHVVASVANAIPSPPKTSTDALHTAIAPQPLTKSLANPARRTAGTNRINSASWPPLAPLARTPTPAPKVGPAAARASPTRTAADEATRERESEARVRALNERAGPAVAESKALRSMREKKEGVRRAVAAARGAALALSQSSTAEEREAATQRVEVAEAAKQEAIAAHADAKREYQRAHEITERLAREAVEKGEEAQRRAKARKAAARRKACAAAHTETREQEQGQAELAQPVAQEGTEQREPEQRETTDHEETQEDELSQTNQRLEAEPSRPSPASTVSEEP